MRSICISWIENNIISIQFVIEIKFEAQVILYDLRKKDIKVSMLEHHKCIILSERFNKILIITPIILICLPIEAKVNRVP